jgi:heme A synthase
MSISRSFTRFTLWCVLVTFALIVAGGVVRTTGSGDACPDWPLCFGQVIPPPQPRIWIEWTHRLVTTLVYSSVLVLVCWVSLRYRADKLIFLGAWLAFFLLIVQIVLGGLVVILQVPPALVGIHLANALLILATLITVSLYAQRPWEGVSASASPHGSRIAVPEAGSLGPAQSDPRLRRLIVLSAAAVYVLIFSGSVVTGTNSLVACLGWPLCNDGFLPSNVFQAINLTHRYFAAAVGVLLIYTLAETLRRYRANRLLRRAAHTAIGLFGLQIVLSAINVLTLFQPFWNSLHLAAATAVWGAMVAFAVIGGRALGGSSAPAQTTTGVNPVAQPYTPASSGR